MTRTFAHISDLHVGRDGATDAAAATLCDALVAARVDEVLLTGDVTHRGRQEELASFRATFAPLADRLVVVPGNHDRLGDDAACGLMPGRRVDVEIRPGLFVVRVDSTAPHNANVLDRHGELLRSDLDEVGRALAAAPRGRLAVVMLHHQRSRARAGPVARSGS